MKSAKIKALEVPDNNGFKATEGLCLNPNFKKAALVVLKSKCPVCRNLQRLKPNVGAACGSANVELRPRSHPPGCAATGG